MQMENLMVICPYIVHAPNQPGQIKKSRWLIFFPHKDSANYLNNLKKRLEEAEKKKKALQKDLQNAQKQLNGIKTGESS